MGVAKATVGTIAATRIDTFYIFYVIISIVITMTDCGSITNCPSQCNCYFVFPNDLTDPPTYIPVQDGQAKGHLMKAVTCQRRQLTDVPKGFPEDTAVLYLAYNQLKHIDRSMFQGLTHIVTLNLSHNKIQSIANDTFDGIKKLQQVDISYNNMRELPKGFLCPWYPREIVTSENELQCEGREAYLSQIRFIMAQNPWHCNCRLQEFVEHYACAYGNSPCIEFYMTPDHTTECNSPTKLNGVSISRLSSQDATDTHNLCSFRNHVDIPLLVTMFTWMGAVLGYVIYFILWNQTEIANHRSYLASLHARSEATTSARPEFPPKEPRRRDITASDSVLIRTTASRDSVIGHEPKTIRKDTPALTISEPSNPTVWVEKSASDISWDCDEGYLMARQAESVRVRPMFLRNKVRPSASYPSNLQKTGNEEVYKLSSL